MKHVLKRGLSLILVCVMVLALLPTAALAAGRPGGNQGGGNTTRDVYVYVQVVDSEGKDITDVTTIGQLNNLLGQNYTVNNKGYLTIGTTSMQLEKPKNGESYDLTKTENSSKLESAKTAVNSITRHIKNTGVNLNQVTWTTLSTAYGATDLNSNDTMLTWHLDGIIKIADLIGLSVNAQNVEIVYDGQDHGLENITVTASGATADLKESDYSITVAYTDENDNTIDGEPKNAGTYTATVTVTLKNYSSISVTTTASVTITPKPVTVSLSANDKEYDGNTTAQGTLTVTGTVEGDTVIATADSIVFDNKNVGTDKTVTASGITLNNSNYKLSDEIASVTDTADITAKELTVTVTPTNRAYNGSSEVAVTVGELSGVITGDSVSLDNSPATGTMQDANAGENKTVTVDDLSLTGTDADNYKLTVTVDTVTISKAEVTIIVTNATKNYGDDDPEFTGTVAGVVEGDNLNVSYARAESDKDKENVGDEITITASYTENNNYDVKVTEGKLTITAANTNAVSVTPYSGTYDGTAHSIIATAAKEGSTLYYSTGDGDNKNWSTENPTFTDAGTYTVYVKATNANYADTAVASATVTITAREITVTADSASKVYDGTALTKNSWTITSGTLVSGHKADVIITGSQTNVGSSSNVPSGAKITDGAGNDVTANYSVAYVNGTLTVTKANKPYVPPYTPPVTPVQPSKPTLNLNDHVAYIIGDDKGLVRPMANITRAEVATIFFRLMTDESRTEYWCTTNSFPDVADTAWYNNAVSTLANAGILLGRPDGTFGPQEYITRAEFAAIAARFSDVKYEGGYTFPDVPETHWAYNDIGLAYQLGWVLGQPDGNFAPNRNITRAEAITLINRVLERDVEEEHLLPDMITWPDNLPNAWYYEAIQEATNSHTYTRTDDQVPSQSFYYEDWYEIIENPDWVALERDWIAASGK